MARKSLRPYLNQIRAWTRQGRTDAWVAHQLEVSVQEVAAFKRQNQLAGEDAAGLVGSGEEEIDLRAADEALIAAELEAAELAAAEEAKAAQDAAAERKRAEEDGDEEGDEEGDEAPRASRRRSRRGGSSRRGAARSQRGPIEGTFDHGEEGYGLWLDPAVRDNPVYAEHWAGHRPIEIAIEEDQIVIRRLGEDGRESAQQDAQDEAA